MTQNFPSQNRVTGPVCKYDECGVPAIAIAVERNVKLVPPSSVDCCVTSTSHRTYTQDDSILNGHEVFVFDKHAAQQGWHSSNIQQLTKPNGERTQFVTCEKSIRSRLRLVPSLARCPS